MLKEILKQIQALFPKAKLYEADKVVQNGLFLSFEGANFLNAYSEYSFKLLVVGNSLNKNSQSVLPQCDELVSIIDKNGANCVENYPSKLFIQSISKSFVREGLFCYELAFALQIRLLKGV